MWLPRYFNKAANLSHRSERVGISLENSSLIEVVPQAFNTFSTGGCRNFFWDHQLFKLVDLEYAFNWRSARQRLVQNIAGKPYAGYAYDVTLRFEWERKNFSLEQSRFSALISLPNELDVL